MAPQGDGADEYKSYKVQPTVTSEDGVVRFNEFYYGYYKLTEQGNGDSCLLYTSTPTRSGKQP